MECVNCGNMFYTEKTRGRKAKYCCKKCRNEYQAKMTPHELVCQQCGKTFLSRGSKRQFCSRECSHASHKTGRTIHQKICPYCGKMFETVNKKQKYCSSSCASRNHADDIRGEYFCEYCGKSIHSDHPKRHRFCSRECATKYRVIQYLPEKFAKEKAEREARKREKQEFTKECPNCGVPFIPTVWQQRFCSYKCQYENSLKKSHSEYVTSFVPYVFTCAECGKQVVTAPNEMKRVYCSEECGIKNWKRLYKRNREKQIREAFVENVELWNVYKRDAGICSICGLPVPDINDPANVWSPTVDHIVPLSIGGSHSYTNCQLSHRLCNSFKGKETEFTIDWAQKLSEEPGRWNKHLDELREMLGGDMKNAV